MTDTTPSSPVATRDGKLAAIRARLVDVDGLISVRSGWLVLGALVVMSTVLRGVGGALVPSPWINGDEVIYAELGRSLWQTGHFEILGASTRIYSFAYPALIGGPLSLHDTELGYALVKWLQAALMSLAAVPVYLWGRSLASRGWALVAAALTLAIPGLAYSGLLMTEVAFYPVLVLAAWATARALESPTVARQVLALAVIGLAVATRLQALVLAPAYVTAVALYVVLNRDGRRSALRHLPAAAGIAVLAAGWSVWQIWTGSGRGTDVLGAYRAAGEASYGFVDAAKYVAYHAADVVLLTGVIPACAVALLLIRGRELSAAVRAYLAVTISLTAWFVVEVGVFASRLVGTLAERNLFELAPLFFLGLVVWLRAGASRGRVSSIAVGGAAIGLVALTPLNSLLNKQSQWEAFTLLPFHELRSRVPGANPRLLVLDLAFVLLVLTQLVPRRRLWLVPCSLLAVFAILSTFATRTVTEQARSTESYLVGGDRHWIDEAAAGPVAFLTGGETFWPAAYENLFWNRRVRRVYTLPGFGGPGPLPQTPVGPEVDGRVVFADGRPAPARFVVASNTLTVFGTKLAASRSAKLVLWRAPRPLRLSTWLTGISIVSSSVDPRGDLSVEGSMASDAQLTVYDCSGAFKLKLVGHAVPTRVEISRNGRVVRRGQVRSWLGWYATIPALPRRPAGACDLEIRSTETLGILLELNRA